MSSYTLARFVAISIFMVLFLITIIRRSLPTPLEVIVMGGMGLAYILLVMYSRRQK